MIDGISFKLLIHALGDPLQDPVTLLGVELPLAESALSGDDLLAVLIIYWVKCVIILFRKLIDLGCFELKAIKVIIHGLDLLEVIVGFHQPHEFALVDLSEAVGIGRGRVNAVLLHEYLLFDFLSVLSLNLVELFV
jgi:hypothetical protein